MKLLIDMNLSPQWCALFGLHGIEAQHWSTIGEPAATDRQIMEWAADHGFAVLTHDLDFSALLAATGERGPSVIQVRALDVLPVTFGQVVVNAIQRHRLAINQGAIVVIEVHRERVRILPLTSG